MGSATYQDVPLSVGVVLLVHGARVERVRVVV